MKKAKSKAKKIKITPEKAKTFCNLIKLGSTPGEAAKSTQVSLVRWNSAEARKIMIPGEDDTQISFSQALEDAEEFAAGKLELKFRAGILDGVARGDLNCMRWANKNMPIGLIDPDAAFTDASGSSVGSIKEQARAAMPNVVQRLKQLLNGNSAIAAIQAAQALEKLADLGSVQEDIPPLVFGNALEKHEQKLANGLKELDQSAK